MQVTKTRSRVKTTVPGKRSIYGIMEPYLFLLPALIIFILFLYYPFVRTVYLSTFLTNALGVAKKYVGLRNYVKILAPDSPFWPNLLVTFKFVGLVAFGGLLIGLVTSLLTAGKYPGKTVASAVYAVPVAIASAAASMTFRMILHPTNGLLNILLGTQINWIGDHQYALYSVAAMTVWLTSGINFIFLSAGLRGIPEELYESASLDGAGYWKKQWHITLPGLSPALFFQVIINIIGGFQAFSQIRLLTHGGPGEDTMVIVYAIYRDAFENSRFHEAAARSVILFFIILVITLIQFSMEKRSVHY